MKTLPCSATGSAILALILISQIFFVKDTIIGGIHREKTEQLYEAVEAAYENCNSNYDLCRHDFAVGDMTSFKIHQDSGNYWFGILEQKNKILQESK